jgi:hypothetical protein
VWPTVANSDPAPSTISDYEGALRPQGLLHIGDCRLRTLRRIDMAEWLGTLRAAGYSNSTVHGPPVVAGMVFGSRSCGCRPGAVGVRS